jgi:HEAT repeat protein
MITQSTDSSDSKRAAKYILLVMAVLAFIFLSYEVRDRIEAALSMKQNIANLSIEDTVKSEAAIEMLVEQGTISVEPLVAALNDINSFQNAAWALSRIKDKRAVAPLIKVLEDETIDPVYKIPVIYALGELHDQQAVNALIILLGDRRLNVCSSAAIALGKIKDPRAVDQLIAVLKDKDWPVRRDIIWALGNIRDARALEPIIDALDDKRIDVQRSAVRALGQMQESNAVQPLFEYFKKRQLATDEEVNASLFETISALGKIGTPALNTLNLLIEKSGPNLNKYILYVTDKINK